MVVFCGAIPGTTTTPTSLSFSRISSASATVSRRSHRNMPAAGRVHAARPERCSSAASWITAARCAYSRCMALMWRSKPEGPQALSISLTIT